MKPVAAGRRRRFAEFSGKADDNTSPEKLQDHENGLKYSFTRFIN
jgi:hypothetical protein